MNFISVLLGSWRPRSQRLQGVVGAGGAKSTWRSCREAGARSDQVVTGQGRTPRTEDEAMTPQTHDDRSRRHALYVLCVGMLMIVLDVTIVNVALPSIQDDLGFSGSSLAWVVNAYLIAFGGLLLLAGRLGDLIGRRRVFLAGLATFTGASLLFG